MKLHDLNRPSLLARTIRNIALAWCVLAMLYAFMTERKNVMLTRANLTLVRLLDEELAVAQTRIDVLEQVQSDVTEALRTRGSMAADSVLRQAEDR